MKNTLSILKFYFSYTTSLLVMVLIGLTCCVAYIFISNAKIQVFFANLGFFLAFLFPLLVSCFSFRELISNRRLRFVPSLELKAGYALLILTILFAFHAPVLNSLFGKIEIPEYWGLKVFCGASLFIALSQIIITRWYGIIIFSIVPLISSAFIRYFNLGENFAKMFSNTNFLYSCFFICILGWVIGLLILKIKTQFEKPLLNFSFSNHQTKAATASLVNPKSSNSVTGKFHRFRNSIRTSGGTILFSAPDNFFHLTWVVVLLTMLFPSCTFFIPLLFKLFPGEPLENFLFNNAYLSLCLYMGFITHFVHGTLITRSRLIWLRMGGTRLSLWNYLDNKILSSIGRFILAITLTSIIFGIAGWQSWLNCLHFLLIYFCISISTTYLTTLFSAMHWSFAILGITLLIINVPFFWWGVFPAYKRETYSALVYFEIGIICLGILARYITKRKFITINWKPIKQLYVSNSY